jgi:hypothetical protein
MRKTLLLAALISAACGASPLIAQVDSTNVKAIVDRLIALEKTTQKNQEAWAVERAELQARSTALKATLAFLKDRKATDETRFATLEQSLADLELQIAHSGEIQDSLQSALNGLCEALEPIVRGDLPFRSADRRSRLDGLKADIASADVPPAEKVRKLFEMLQTEAAYGITAEVAEQRVAVGTDTLLVEVLRVGSLALLWRTPRGDRAGRFDRATASWVELPAESRGRIGRAIEMASRERPFEVVPLPVGRIEP